MFGCTHRAFLSGSSQRVGWTTADSIAGESMHHAKALPKPPLPRPSPRTTLEAPPYPILRGLSRPRCAAPRSAWLRAAPAGLPRRAGGAGRARPG